MCLYLSFALFQFVFVKTAPYLQVWAGKDEHDPQRGRWEFLPLTLTVGVWSLSWVDVIKAGHLPQRSIQSMILFPPLTALSAFCIISLGRFSRLSSLHYFLFFLHLLCSLSKKVAANSPELSSLLCDAPCCSQAFPQFTCWTSVLQILLVLLSTLRKPED